MAIIAHRLADPSPRRRQGLELIVLLRHLFLLVPSLARGDEVAFSNGLETIDGY